uniref:Uncharacterized protein n=1 Tax=Anguilla anguilla TaxID=7936 RepID=A0A0E9PYI5_ANGAN
MIYSQPYNGWYRVRVRGHMWPKENKLSTNSKTALASRGSTCVEPNYFSKHYVKYYLQQELFPMAHATRDRCVQGKKYQHNIKTDIYVSNCE